MAEGRPAAAQRRPAVTGRRLSRRRQLALAAVVATTVVTVVVPFLLPASRESLFWAQGLVNGFGVLVAVVVLARGSADRMGWWMLVAFGLLAMSVLTLLSDWAFAQGHQELAAWATLVFGSIDSDGTGVLTPIFFVGVLLLVLVYPDGHIPGRWRWYPVSVGLAVSTTVVAAAFRELRTGAGTVMQNPLVGDLAQPGAADVADLGVLIAALHFPLAIASLISRYHSPAATWVQRQQIKWFALGVGVYATALLALLVEELLVGAAQPELFIVVDAMAFTGIPLSIGLAVLRYRLYDVDRIVSRTLAYAIVLALLAGLFVLLVTSPLLVLGPRADQVPPPLVSVATLVVAAVFAPLRRRVQHAVDRRFDRALVDARQVVDAFGEDVGRLTDVASIETAITEVVPRALGACAVGVWVADPRRNDPVPPR